MIDKVSVHVPATSANLGPGLDCLALALDLWNEVTFEVVDGPFEVIIEGEGQNWLPTGVENLVAQAALKLISSKASEVRPVSSSGLSHIRITCFNRIPTDSGLGSSAAAIVSGLMGANAMFQLGSSHEEILSLATEIEGHPDNAAAAIYGGLVVVIKTNAGKPLVRSYTPGTFTIALALPDIKLSTHAARQALPKMVSITDAVFNLGRMPLVVEALRNGDLDLLSQAMDDRLHQPYRLPLIQGAQEAMEAAYRAGASTVALSGAGPSLIAFCQENPGPVVQAMLNTFASAGVHARGFQFSSSARGAQVNSSS